MTDLDKTLNEYFAEPAMSDLISRAGVVKWYCRGECDSEPCKILCPRAGELQDFPSAEPQIVRCGDCTWFVDNECLHSLGLVAPFDHCYCSYGERRADE